MMFVLMISSVAAVEDKLGTFKVNESVNLIQICGTCTTNNITTVLYPNSTVAIVNVEMTENNSYYNYTLNGSIVDVTGTWVVNGEGDLDGIITAWSYTFDVTYGGKQLDSAQAILYGFLFLILILFFIGVGFGISKLPPRNEPDPEGRIMSISYLKYFRSTLWFVEWMLVIAVMYLSSNLAFQFLQETLFADILFMVFNIMLAITPIIVIVWFLWFFVKIKEDKQLKRMLERGLFGSQGGRL